MVPGKKTSQRLQAMLVSLFRVHEIEFEDSPPVVHLWFQLIIMKVLSMLSAHI